MSSAPDSQQAPLGPCVSLDDKRARLRLFRSSRVGPVTYRKLMVEHGSAEAALEALPEIATQAGLAKYTPACPRRVAAEIKAGQRIGAKLLCLGDADYPAALAETDTAPPLLWWLGNLDVIKRPMVALVGTRNASSLGARMARRLCEELGEAGIVTVSGLARGIDTVVHHTSLESGTIAVQAGGLDVVYPSENATLACDILGHGLRLSEAPMGHSAQARDFPKRNRIISGLASAVVVVEAAAKSGSMITARTALDQGREVLAVPGHPFEARSAGCNHLINDGARIVRSAEDILEVLQKPEPTAPEPAPPSTAKEPCEALTPQILGALSVTPRGEADLMRDIDHPAADVAAQLSMLELQGAVIREPGGRLSLAP